MTYYPDLSPYEHYNRSAEEGVVNIGWLDIAHDYPQGEVLGSFLDKLRDFCRVSVCQFSGAHFCEFCCIEPVTPLRQLSIAQCGEEILVLGSAEIRAFGWDGTVYAAPNLIYHYIVEHQYCPPDVFIQAVLKGPQPGSSEYQALLSQHDWPVSPTFHLPFAPIKLELADVMKQPPMPLLVGESIIDRDGFVSGGLGLSREMWERVHTRSGVDSSFDRLSYDYDDDKYSVYFKDGCVQRLVWGDDENPCTFDEARAKSATLIPQDSQFIKTYIPEYASDFIVDLYLSKSLKERFGSDEWPGGKPGNFIVRHLHSFGRIESMCISTGNQLW